MKLLQFLGDPAYPRSRQRSSWSETRQHWVLVHVPVDFSSDIGKAITEHASKICSSRGICFHSCPQYSVVLRSAIKPLRPMSSCHLVKTSVLGVISFTVLSPHWIWAAGEELRSHKSICTLSRGGRYKFGITMLHGAIYMVSLWEDTVHSQSMTTLWNGILPFQIWILFQMHWFY